MRASAVELQVGGKSYRVIASAEEDDLRRFARMVDEKLRGLTPPGRTVQPQAMLLAAIALAHDLEEERARRQFLEARSREMLTTVLERIDAALGEADTALDAPAPPEQEPAPDV